LVYPNPWPDNRKVPEYCHSDLTIFKWPTDGEIRGK
jgi:hypothetical protein